MVSNEVYKLSLYNITTEQTTVVGFYVALAIFQPYRDMEAGDNQSLKS